MKKILALVLCAVLAAAFVGCTQTADVDDVIDTVASIADVSGADVSAADAIIDEVASATDIDADTLTAALDAIANYHPGTAGSSLTGAAAAISALDFAQANEADAEAITTAAKEYFDALDAEQQEWFVESFNGVDEIARQIIAEGTDSYAELLADAGITAADTEYAIEKYEALADALKAALGL